MFSVYLIVFSVYLTVFSVYLIGLNISFVSPSPGVGPEAVPGVRAGVRTRRP